jgi:phage host-nuclease inhibitor protein Gam
VGPEETVYSLDLEQAAERIDRLAQSVDATTSDTRRQLTKAGRTRDEALDGIDASIQERVRTPSNTATGRLASTLEQENNKLVELLETLARSLRERAEDDDDGT